MLESLKSLQLTRFTKSLFLLSLALIAYGYVCRIVNLYFFWESKTLGWTLLLMALISFLFERKKAKKQKGKETLSDKILIGITIFLLFVESLLFFVAPTTNAYAAARQFIYSNEAIRNEVGEINGLFLIPAGAYATSSGAGGESGEADLNITVKGSRKYKDINLLLEKATDTNWMVEIIEE